MNCERIDHTLFMRSILVRMWIKQRNLERLACLAACRGACLLQGLRWLIVCLCLCVCMCVREMLCKVTSSPLARDTGKKNGQKLMGNLAVSFDFVEKCWIPTCSFATACPPRESFLIIFHAKEHAVSSVARFPRRGLHFASAQLVLLIENRKLCSCLLKFWSGGNAVGYSLVSVIVADFAAGAGEGAERLQTGSVLWLWAHLRV